MRGPQNRSVWEERFHIQRAPYKDRSTYTFFPQRSKTGMNKNSRKDDSRLHSSSASISNTHFHKMALLQYPNSIDATDVQVWNNAAFDDGATDAVIKSSFSSIPSIASQSVDSDSNSNSNSCKENHNPSFCRSPVCIKSPVTLNPLCPKNSQGKPLKVLFKEGLLSPIQNVSDTGSEVVRDVGKIDAEMEEIQNEITRLSIKLESLRLEKEDRILKPARFVHQKQSSKVSLIPRVSMGPSEISAGVRSQRGIPEITPIQLGKNRRGISLGPSEIAAGVRVHRAKPELTPIQPVKSTRGVTLGPSEIMSGVRSQQREKYPLSTQHNRRKSCFYKIQQVDEEKVTKKSGGRSLSLSPKARQAHSKIQPSERRFTTIGSNKTVRKNDRILSSIQPKNLFKEGEQLAPGRRLIKSGRVVPSRYNQISIQCNGSQVQNDGWKMSFPGNDETQKKKCERKRSSSVGRRCVFLQETGSSQNSENKVEMPSQAMRLTNNNTPSITKVADFLPKIRTIRSIYESPRDSGPAKRVAELMGRKSYFGEEKSSVDTTVCQALSFDEEEEE